MARSLIANAFFFGSLFVAGALANPDAAADGAVPPHSMQEQTRKFNMNKARGKVGKAVRKLDSTKRKFNNAKVSDETPSACATLARQCDKAEAKWPAAGDRDCNLESEKMARKQCAQCNKYAKKCTAANKKLSAKADKASKLEQLVTDAENRLNAEVQQCRAPLSEQLDCTHFCAHGKPSGVEASTCVCTCDENWFGQKCDKTSTVRMPPSTPATPCCESGARSVEGAKPAKWRASFPDEALNSRMPDVVMDSTAEGSTVSVVCDHTRNGPLAVKHELRKTDRTLYGSKRCESHTLKQGRPAVRSLRQAPVSGIEKGKETFYGMSVYLGGKNADGTWAWPFNNEAETHAESKVGDILFQWKGMGEDKDTAQLDEKDPSKKPNCDDLPGGCKPFMTLQQKYRGLHLLIVAEKATVTLVPEVDRTQWYDIRIRVRWETDGSLGEVEAEAKPASQSLWDKPRMYGAQKGNKVWKGATMTGNFDAYLKWGLYLPHWQAEADDETPEDGVHGSSDVQYTPHTKRTVWHDNIAVGDCWQSVDPSANDCDASEAATCSAADQ